MFLIIEVGYAYVNYACKLSQKHQPVRPKRKPVTGCTRRVVKSDNLKHAYRSQV